MTRVKKRNRRSEKLNVLVSTTGSLFVPERDLRVDPQRAGGGCHGRQTRDHHKRVEHEVIAQPAGKGRCFRHAGDTAVAYGRR